MTDESRNRTQDAAEDAGQKQRVLPEPSLKTFVSGLAGQVLINLGLFENPATGKKETDLEMAKYSIDLLQILQDKMKGNLTEEEDKLMKTILYDLRMRYVEACR
jgi:hypothetical protein